MGKNMLKREYRSSPPDMNMKKEPTRAGLRVRLTMNLQPPIMKDATQTSRTNTYCLYRTLGQRISLSINRIGLIETHVVNKGYNL